MSIRTDLTNEEYHALPALSKSQLDDLDKSAYIFWQRHRNPNRPPRPEPTPAMMLGTMVHTAVLEPELFASSYVLAPKIDRRTKEGKLDYEAFISTYPDHTPISQDDMLRCDGMRLSVGTIAPIAELLAKGKAEVSAFWTDFDTGVMCRCRPDWVHGVGDNGVILMDLKTCQSASPKEFVKSIVNWNYSTQAAFYSDGWEAATGQKVHGFVFAAVEKDFPYAAAAYMLDDDSMESGRRRYKRLLRTYAQCMESGEWPGYSTTGIELLTLPAWGREPTE